MAKQSATGSKAEDPMVERLRAALKGLPIHEQKMFGGTCFMLSGNMLVGTSKRGLLVRVGKDAHAAAAAFPHAASMEMGGRPMQGYVFVAPAGTASAKDLSAWIKRARTFVDTLPSKLSKAPRSKTSKTSAKARKPKKPVE